MAAMLRISIQPKHVLILLYSCMIGAFMLLPLIIDQLHWMIAFTFSTAILGSLIFRYFNQTTTESEEYPFRTTMRFAIFLIIGLSGSFLIFQSQAILKALATQREMQSAQLKEVTEATRKNGLTVLMNDALDKARAEWTSPAKTISDETVHRISWLSNAFEPQPISYLETDPCQDLLSMERGLLLYALIQMQLDSQTFARIKAKTTFSGADLRHVDLSRADLSGITLSCADLSNANLHHAKLNHAILKGTKLWGANLTGADISISELNRVNLQWADLSDADLRWADLRNADLRNSKLRHSDLRNAIVSYADLRGAVCNDAKMECITLVGSMLAQTNFTNADMNQADLRIAIIYETNFMNTNLHDVRLDKTIVDATNWLSNLDNWQIQCAQEIRENYKIIKDPAKPDNIIIVTIKH